VITVLLKVLDKKILTLSQEHELISVISRVIVYAVMVLLRLLIGNNKEVTAL